MATLVDTNVLVYRFDPRFPNTQAQADVELVAAVTRPLNGSEPLLPPEDAWREADELLSQFVVLYPTESLLRTAIRGCATYELGWVDAHLWACAEEYGLDELLSEDFQHDRVWSSESGCLGDPGRVTDDRRTGP